MMHNVGYNLYNKVTLWERQYGEKYALSKYHLAFPIICSGRINIFVTLISNADN